MVLSTRLKDERMAGRAEGREEGHAAGLEEGRAEGLEEGRVKGKIEGRQEGLAAGHAETALEMLKDKEPLSKIVKYSRMSEEEIYALAQANGLEIVG